MEAPVSTWFRNIKNLPPSGTPEYDHLVEQEIDRCKGGVHVNGIFISGWLYFHLNHWHIRIDSQDKYGNDVRINQYPDLRDNEWIRAEALEQCRILRKGYMEVGLRQGGKSEFEASFTAYNALMFENTQNVVVGGNNADLSLITDKLDHGLNNMWDGIAVSRIDKDWKKPLVRLGYKDKKNNDVIWSYIVIRNADGGDNTEAPAGTTSKSFIMDEIGKYMFGQTFEAAKPAFLSQFGWRTIPVCVGTGGSFQKGADAERFFNNPDANNFLSFEDKETGKKTCLFMSGLYRQDCKYETTLDHFLAEVYSIELQDVSELCQIPIRVSDKEVALAKIRQERITKAKDPDRTEYLKVIMYHPLTTEECFMSAENNMFNVEAAKKQKERLISESLFGTPVEIINDGEGLSHRFTDKKPILEYPLSANADKEGCVVMHEPPIKNAPFGLYVLGIDPYKQDESKYSDSLGSIFVFKRMHNITTEKYQDMFVAEYTGRPKRFNDWAEIARNLIKYYNGIALVESEDYAFIRYMLDKGEYRYLMPQPPWLKMISPNTSVNRDFGLPATPRVIAQLNGTLKTYSEEIILTEYDENKVIIKEYLGMTKVLSLPLLDEMSKYNPDGNFDRIRAASLAIEAARRMDADNIRPESVDGDPRLQSYFNKHKKTNHIVKTFGQSSPLLLNSKNKSVARLLS